MRMYDVIMKKRNGKVLTKEETMLLNALTICEEKPVVGPLIHARITLDAVGK